MASIHKDLALVANPAAVWDVVRDVGAIHTRFAPGVVTDVVLGEGERTVTFAGGLVLRELIIDVDEERRRLAYAVVGSFEHHSASFQVFPDGNGSRLVWIADLLPDDAAPGVAELMTAGLAVAKSAIDG